MGVETGLRNQPLNFPRTPPPGMDPQVWAYLRDFLERMESKGSAAMTAHETSGGQNLLTKGAGGAGGSAATEARVSLDDVSVETLGISPGDDVISFGAYVKNDDDTSEVGIQVTFKDSGGSDISQFETAFVTTSTYQRVVRENILVPSNAATVRYVTYRNSGSGTASSKLNVLNIGAKALRFTEAPLRMDRENLDQVNDGDTWNRVLANQLGGGVLLRSKSDNLAQNPVFSESDAATTGNTTTVGEYPIDGWRVFINDVDDNGDPIFTLGAQSTLSLYGDSAFQIFQNPSITMPATSGDLAGAVDQSQVPVKQGDVIFFGGSVHVQNFNNLPAGVDGTARISLLVQDEGGSSVIFATAKTHTANTTGWETDFTSVEITSADAASMVLRLEVLLDNTNGTTTNLSDANPVAVNFDGLILARQIRDPRQQYPLGGWNRSDSLPDSEVLTGTDAGADATINIASHDRLGGFGTTTFPSGSITGLSFSTEYDVYADLPDYDVSTVNYLASTDLTIAMQDQDRVYIGRVTTPANGAGNSTGGVESCLCVDQWVAQDLRVYEVESGDVLLCMTDAGEFEERPVEYASGLVHAECVELTADNGAVVRCSARTPFVTADKHWVFAEGAEGAMVYDDAGSETRITKVKRLGERLVRRISVGGASFPGGVEPHSMVMTHNATAKP